MKQNWYKFFLYFLRSLIYLKRAAVWLFGGVALASVKLTQLYRKTAGFWLYKIWFFIKKVFRRLGISLKGERLDILGRRGTLQVVLFIVAIVIMTPHSRLYTRETNTIPGRNTLLYKIVGPGQYDFEIEAVEVDISELVARRDTRSWREGAVISDSLGSSGAPEGIAIPQEISGISMGGTAINKPTIAPGAEIQTGVGAAGKRTEIVYHEVQPGDVIGSIAEKYGINVVTILWANDLSVRSYIRPGDKLTILPVDGVIHQVKSGDNVSKIANLYDAESSAIIAFNKLQDDGRDIVVGERLLVPGGTRPQPIVVTAPRRTSSFSSLVPPPPSITAPAGSGYLWPTSVRRLTQYYGWRHTGLDIGGPAGTPLYAARGGTVSRSQCGWNGGYGCYIIIDHGSGVQTLYGHASRLYASVGQAVEQGETIALMGSTGRSTGPHVHFEVHINGQRQNPLQYIR